MLYITRTTLGKLYNAIFSLLNGLLRCYIITKALRKHTQCFFSPFNGSVRCCIISKFPQEKFMAEDMMNLDHLAIMFLSSKGHELNSHGEVRWGGGIKLPNKLMKRSSWNANLVLHVNGTKALIHSICTTVANTKQVSEMDTLVHN